MKLKDITERSDGEMQRLARAYASAVVRVAEAATASITRQLHERDGELRRAHAARNHFESKSKEFAATISELQLKLSPRQQREIELTDEIKRLTIALTSLEAKEVTGMRAHAKELADAKAAVAKANSQVTWERDRAAAAGSKAREAKEAARVVRCEAEERVSAVRTEADEAQEELEVMRNEMKKQKQMLKRAQDRAAAAICGTASNRSAEEWAQLSRAAAHKAQQREREWLRTALAGHAWRPVDIAVVLNEFNDTYVESLMGTPIFQKVFIAQVQQLMQRLEKEHFGIAFGMFLHFEMRMTMDKILRLTQAASKVYIRARNRYEPKVLYFDRFEGCTGRRVLVPRIAPPLRQARAGHPTGRGHPQHPGGRRWAAFVRPIPGFAQRSADQGSGQAGRAATCRFLGRQAPFAPRHLLRRDRVWGGTADDHRRTQPLAPALCSTSTCIRAGQLRR
jgi:hypothetical protein